MNTKTKILSGILIGAAIGTATGLMLAPKSGRKTRNKMMTKSKRLADDVLNKANDTLNTAKKSLNQKLDQYLTHGETFVDQN